MSDGFRHQAGADEFQADFAGDSRLEYPLFHQAGKVVREESMIEQILNLPFWTLFWFFLKVIGAFTLAGLVIGIPFGIVGGIIAWFSEK